MENPWLLSMIFAGPIVSYKTMGIFHCQVWLHVIFNMQTCYSTGRLWQIQGNCNGMQRIAMEQLLSCQLIPPATSKCCEHRLLTNPTKIVRTNMLHACQAQGSSVVHQVTPRNHRKTNCRPNHPPEFPRWPESARHQPKCFPVAGQKNSMLRPYEAFMVAEDKNSHVFSSNVFIFVCSQHFGTQIAYFILVFAAFWKSLLQLDCICNTLDL